MGVIGHNIFTHATISSEIMDTLFFPSIANALLLCSLIIFATMLSQDMCSSLSAQCNERDRHLLLNFKHTASDPYAILSTWSDERDCCQWEGIQCDNTTGRVIMLNLPCSPQPSATDCDEEDESQCLTGDLHLSLLQLEFLNYLDLRNHDFHAIIQNDSVDISNSTNISAFECQNSSNLHYLDLSYNEDLHFDSLHWLSCVPALKYLNFCGINLQGRVDWHQLATLVPFLTELRFDSCQLSNISASIHYVNFTSLEFLGLAHNAFSSEFFPDWFGQLEHLQFVDVSENSFSGPIPDWLGQLEHLHFLDVSANSFSGRLPDSLGQLEHLHFLDVSANSFSGPLPDSLGQLKHLQFLDFSENSFTGPIPSTLRDISSLIYLDVSSNYLNGSLPETIGQLFNLKALYFDDNQLTGYVSENFFANLSNLNYLSMGSPGLIFDFNPVWVPPFQLEEVYLDHMVGSKLPPWIYTQMSLSRLVIKYSTISFEPQDKFWDFVARVPYIQLQHNTIHGEISSVLLNSTIINLGSNKIKGNLPRLSPNVAMFNVSHNSFQGPIAPLLCQKMNGTSQLKYVDMSFNLLSGGFTNCWMQCKSLVFVRLDGNNLTGTIPHSIGLLSNLVVLHLNKNNLFGEIPLSLVNCRKLQILDVGENKLSGFLMNWMAQNAKILRLRSNQLSGNIPPQICQLASLRILDFADNKISGSLPICIQNLTAMAFPNSLDNRVYGVCIKTPGFLSHISDNVMVHIKGQGLSYENNLKFLHAIDLSSNNISGSIPPEIFSLTGLESLNLSHNQLEGNIPNEISNLNNLESLDLSRNQLSGEIPQSMDKLSFLEILNLSFNNFTGKIPSGTQLQRSDAQSYIGNPKLCGAPLPKNCIHEQDVEHIEGNDNEEDEFLSSFYIGLGVGFATAFWGVYVAIFFHRNFRHCYFRFLYHIRDKIYVIMVLRMNRFR
ncbi:receptor-like protein EIX2 [Neltuma alba]|uniref:receptor-like protein EIX2 n=1 Tax=Neltuma alba TaxID=207710 RepID=UPI0010A3BD78|nr:receptor-like protein EIX2 [Prosopis alba]